MREKLIESIQYAVACSKRLAGLIADEILADGWIRLPCKVGDTVCGKDHKWTGTVEEIAINSDGIALYVSSGGHAFYAYPAVEELSFSEAALRKEDDNEQTGL